MVAVCPGSFDPVTYGHLDVIARARDLFGQVVVAVGRNSAKNSLFALEERVRLVESATAGWDGVRVAPLEGLLADFCARVGAGVVVKGLRFGSDFDYELQMAHINSAIGHIETVLLPAGPRWGTLSSTMVREVARNGGDVSGFVPPEAAERVRMVQAKEES
ncbi:MAG: pantetheine-phosphate adenylyltransferase [Propionibacteriaceae bacterium]|jgi:pantetheine-phosphate adenylyltransferase|nr:pantetheine-phosphate adenylyltransferase [Propionibacteriaceae bacterium]